MQLKSCAIAVVSAAITIVGFSSVSQAIVAVDQAALDQNRVAPGQFSGVVGIFDADATSPLCTGTLLPGGRNILTTASCLQFKLSPQDNFTIRTPSYVAFNLLDNIVTVPVSNSSLFPAWDGLVVNGNDIAVLLLAEPAPDTASRYEIYRDTDELSQTFTKVGFGRTGTGLLGDITANDSALTAHAGENQFEATEAQLGSLGFTSANPAPMSQLLYDFDSGDPANNLFGSLGLGSREIHVAPGDSGAPAFIGDRIAGISSSQASTFTTDIDDILNSTFGEFSGDTRVSTYASFIDGVIASTTLPDPDPTPATSVPEPSIQWGLGILLSSFFLSKRRTKLI